MVGRRERLPHGRSQSKGTAPSTSRPGKTESERGRKLAYRRPYVSDGPTVQGRAIFRQLSRSDVDKVGFLVNPIAGMGGAVGLKGTDGRKTLKEAIRKGAKPVSPERGLRFLAEVQRTGKGIEFLIAPGRMGENIADQLKLQHETIGRIGRTTTSEDSVQVARLM